MKTEDPWVVWRAFRQLQAKSLIFKDRDRPDDEDTEAWWKIEDVAKQLYKNWQDLSEYQQYRVKLFKLDLVILFLKHHCWIVERYEMRDKPKRFREDFQEREQVYLKEYRARPGVFIPISGMPTATRVDWEKDSMKNYWDEFRGRPTTKQLLARAERRIRKA